MKQTHYGLWVAIPHANARAHTFVNDMTQKRAVRNHTSTGYSSRDAHALVAYLNSRTTFPIFQIGGKRHGKLR